MLDGITNFACFCSSLADLHQLTLILCKADWNNWVADAGGGGRGVDGY